MQQQGIVAIKMLGSTSEVTVQQRQQQQIAQQRLYIDAIAATIAAPLQQQSATSTTVTEEIVSQTAASLGLNFHGGLDKVAVTVNHLVNAILNHGLLNEQTPKHPFRKKEGKK